MAELYVFLDSATQALIADNEIDIVQELRGQGLDVQGTVAGNPATQLDGQERDVALVILASATAFAAISHGIARIIDAVGRNRRYVVEEAELVPVTDADGQVVRGAGGEPQLYWRTGHRAVDVAPSPLEKSKLGFELGGKAGLKVTMESAV